MVYVYARYEVDDYQTWKETFDADAEGRDALGSVGVEVFQVYDDSEDVAVLIQLDDEVAEEAVDGDLSGALTDLLETERTEMPELVPLEKVDERPL